jgi:hypothetical protein
MNAVTPAAHEPAAISSLPRLVLTERWSVGADGTFLGPSCVAPLDEALMLVVDECRHTIAIVDENGTVVRRLGAEGSEPGTFRYPTHAVADGQGGFWVTDRWNHRVQHLDASGRPLGATGSYGTAPGPFNEPWGIAVLDDGRLVVADRSNHRVQVLSADGAPVSVCGRGGYDRSYYEAGGFKRGTVFDRWSALANRFLSHETLFREQGYTLGTLEFPQGLAACGDGQVLVADPGIGAIIACDLAQGRVEPLVSLRSVRFVPANVAAFGNGLFVAVADEGCTACLLDAEGKHAFVDVPGIAHLTACVPGPGSTLWCLDGWNHRLACYDLAVEPPQGASP